MAIAAKHDLQKLAPAFLSFVEPETSAPMITDAEKACADSCGFTVRAVGDNRPEFRDDS